MDLVGVDDGKAIIAFGGGCQGCGMADVTLKQGVEVMIMENVPEIIEVIDATTPHQETCYCRAWLQDYRLSARPS